jgi:uncharacterized membrane protein YgcG
MTFNLWLLLAMTVLGVIFLVWDNSRMTRRAEEQAKDATSRPFPARRVNDRGDNIGDGGVVSFGHDNSDGGDAGGGDGGGGGH